MRLEGEWGTGEPGRGRLSRDRGQLRHSEKLHPQAVEARLRVNREAGRVQTLRTGLHTFLSLWSLFCA